VTGSWARIGAVMGLATPDEGRFRRSTSFRSPIVPHGGTVSRMSWRGCSAWTT